MADRNDPFLAEFNTMIELAHQQLQHYEHEMQKWDAQLLKLEKAKSAYLAKLEKQGQETAKLAADLAAAREQLKASQTQSQSQQHQTPSQARSVNTTFNTLPRDHGITAAQQPQRTGFGTTPARAGPSSASAPQPTYAKALYQYQGDPSTNVMPLVPDEILIIHSTESDWWLCQKTSKDDGALYPVGDRQFAPRNYIRKLDPDDPIILAAQVNHLSLDSHPTDTLHKPVSSQTSVTGARSAGPPQLNQSNSSAFQTPVTVKASAGPPPFNPTTVQSGSARPPARTTSNQSNPPPFNGTATVTVTSAKAPPPFTGYAASNPSTQAAPQVKSNVKMCSALFDYKGDESQNLLSFKRLEKFTVVGDISGQQWWLVKNFMGNQGYVPSNYMQLE